MGLFKKSGPAEAANRIVTANTPASNRRDDYTSNVVITSNYTKWNFVPLFLFQQFSRFANAYFLFVCVLQSIPAISITSGVPTTLIPLSSVLVFDAIVTAIEDYRRHKDDDLNNSTPVLHMRDGSRFTETQWADVIVGDILKVRRGETIPADLVFLHAHTDDGATPDVCYVMTAQLDGETNLKMKQAPRATAQMLNSDEAVANFRGIVECEPPNGVFDKFSGTLALNTPQATAKIPLDANAVLLRGVVLRNVEYAYGIVVYTGAQTKVRVKQGEKKFKRAFVETFINKCTMFLLGLLIVLCVISAALCAIWQIEHMSHWYLRFSSLNAVDVIGSAFTFFLLNSSFIPVSLYVSMKMARQGQQFFMELDKEMYHEDAAQVEATKGAAGHYPLRVRSMDLNDDLGGITHIFSDKTGTLTLNYMEFRKISIRGVSYGLGTTDIGISRLKRMGRDTTALEEIAANIPKGQPAHVNFTDGSDTHPGVMLAYDARPGSSRHQAVNDMLIHMLTNHSVVVERIRNEEGAVVGRQLSASSPDEEAFVNMTTVVGYSFIDRVGDDILLEIHGRPMRATVLANLPYNQMRKRMSVVVRMPDGRVCLFCKGADNVIFARLAPPTAPDDAAVYNNSVEQLANWGTDGLRTLVFACRVLDPTYFARWNDQFLAANGDMAQLSARKAGQPNMIDQLMDQLETQLTLQGATANEDKLQPGVPETIASLALAGIRTWMLTGDKLETAVNIAYSTKLFTSTMKTVNFASSEMSAEALPGTLAELAAEFKRAMPPNLHYGLIIDEKNMDCVLDEGTAETRANLLLVTQKCKAVVCCRCRPDQKAAIVKLIKDGVPTARTLAIGDGANDVDMIQTAHVGVGIAGAEGVQAANASDYSIGRFRFLQRLLLVHGQWNQRRISKLVLYMFYKNIAFVLAQYWFSIYNGFSGQKFYIELATQTFNLVYTGFPSLLLGLLDQDVSADMAMRFPLLYIDGPKRKRLNAPLFAGWFVSALLESLICFFGTIYFYQTTVRGNGTPSPYEVGMLIFHAIIAIVSVRVAVETHQHNRPFQVLLFLSVISIFPAFLLFDVLDANSMRGGVIATYGKLDFWLVILLLVAAAGLRIVAWKSWKRYFMTDNRHLVQEADLIVNNAETLEQKLQVATSGVSQRALRMMSNGSGMGINREMTSSMAVISTANPAAIHKPKIPGESARNLRPVSVGAGTGTRANTAAGGGTTPTARGRAVTQPPATSVSTQRLFVPEEGSPTQDNPMFAHHHQTNGH